MQFALSEAYPEQRGRNPLAHAFTGLRRKFEFARPWRIGAATAARDGRRARGEADGGFDRGVDSGIEPTRVAEVVQRALTLRLPKLRMRVGSDAHQLHFIYHRLPSAIFATGMRQRFG